MSEEQEIPDNTHVIGIVGISANTESPSHHIGQFFKEYGYRISPVHVA